MRAHTLHAVAIEIGVAVIIAASAQQVVQRSGRGLWVLAMLSWLPCMHTAAQANLTGSGQVILSILLSHVLLAHKVVPHTHRKVSSLFENIKDDFLMANAQP